MRCDKVHQSVKIRTGPHRYVAEQDVRQFVANDRGALCRPDARRYHDQVDAFAGDPEPARLPRAEVLFGHMDRTSSFGGH